MTQVLRQLLLNRKRRAAIAGMVLLFCAIVAVSILGNTITGVVPQQQTIALSSASFAHVEQEDLYYFDGLSFHKTNLKSKAHSLLSQPARLPDIDNLWWAGDKGAFVTFSGSFDNTVAEGYVYEFSLFDYNEHDLSRNFLWYIDFASGDITMINNEYVDAYKILYDGSDSAYIFSESPDIEEGLNAENEYSKTKLRKFSLPLLTFTQTYPTSDIAYIDSISPCTGSLFCVVGSADGKKAILMKLQEDELVELATTPYGSILPTNNKDIFLILDSKLTSKQIGSLNDDDSVTGPYSVGSYSIKSSAFRSLGFKIPDSTTIVPYLTSTSDTLIYSDSGTPKTIVRSKNKLGMLINKSVGDATPEGVIVNGEVSFSSDGEYAVTQTLDEHYLLIGGKSKFSAIEDKTHISSVSSCVGADASYSYDETANRFNITVLYSETMATEVKNIAGCIYKNEINTASMFNILVMSPTTGQIISL